MSLDAHTLDLEELRYGLSNVTCLRIFDHEDSRTRSYLADWKARGSDGVKIPKQTHEITVRYYYAHTSSNLHSVSHSDLRRHAKSKCRLCLIFC